MKILVIGGTRFVGRHFVEAAQSAGHDLTLFHRGRSGADLFPAATHVLGDRDRDLSGLATGEWDATVDVCGYFPRQVTALADALGRRGGQYLFVSSVSAYADAQAPGAREDAPLATVQDEDAQEVTAENYGGLKAACERVALERFGPSTLLVRPTYVVGPWDPTGRFTYWARRIDRGGDVLVPGPAGQAVQVIDGRDLARWMVELLGLRASGAFHAAAPAPPFAMADLLAAIAAAVAPPGTRLVWADPSWLTGQKPQGGDTDSWPLWHGGGQDWIGAVDPSAAQSTGLRPRPLADTVKDTLDHPGTPEVDGIAPSSEREQELLTAWSRRP